MSYEIIWDEKAQEFLRKLSNEDAKRIIKKVNSVVEDPKHYLETLVEMKCYKLRVGDYRALIDLDENNQKISVLIVGHRKDIYKYTKRTGFGHK